MDFINPISVPMDEVEEYIANDKIDLAVIINENASGMDFETGLPVTIISSQNSTLAGYMETVLSTRIADYESQVQDTAEVSESEVGKKRSYQKCPGNDRFQNDRYIFLP